jgi:hypothetical protein
MAVPPDKGLLWLVSCLCLLKEISRLILEPTTGLEPVNLFLTKEVLYQLSYVGSIRGVSGRPDQESRKAVSLGQNAVVLKVSRGQ